MNKLLVMALVFSSVSLAETKIYRSEDEKGNVRFSDRLPYAVEEVTEIKVDIDAQNTVPSKQYQQDIKENDKARKRLAREDDRKRKFLDQEIQAAKERLASTEEALLKADERKAGDFIAKSGGGVRPSPDYLKRIEKLKADNEAASLALSALEKDRAKL